MYLSRMRLGGLIVAAFAAMAGWSAASACEDIAVLSTDARYLVLSGNTLEIRDVGKLWWLGIRGVDYVIPDSTLARAALWTDSRHDLETGTWTGPTSALVSLQDLGRQLTSVSDLILALSSSEYDSYRWVNDDPQNRLLRIHSNGDEYFVALVRTDLTQERQWRSPIVRLGSGVSCVVDDRLFVGGLEARLFGEGDELVVESIARRAPSNNYRLVGISMGCTVMVSEPQLPTLLVDLSTNEVVTEFRAKAQTRVVLFDSGRKLLQQDITRVPVEGVDGHRVGYTGHMTVADTSNGEFLREVTLNGSGEMSRLMCRNEAERVVLSDTGMVHLVDLDSLEIIATQPVPFHRYFVF